MKLKLKLVLLLFSRNFEGIRRLCFAFCYYLVFLPNYSFGQINDVEFQNVDIRDFEFTPQPYNLVTWQEVDGSKLWVADVNPFTGLFSNFTIVDTSVCPMNNLKNGPEWAYSMSQLNIVYTKITPSGKKELARAWQNSSSDWITEILANTSYFNLSRKTPFGNNDSKALYPLKVHYLVESINGYYSRAWREIGNPATETEFPASLTQYVSVGKTLRWVNNTEKIITTSDDANGYTQIVLYDIRSGNISNLTNSQTYKDEGYMWKSVNPKFLGKNMFLHTFIDCNVNAYLEGINIYYESQSGVWTLLNQIIPPINKQYLHYIDDPKAFVVNGNSYIYFLVYDSPFHNPMFTSQVWVSPADPSLGNPFRVSGSSTMIRLDPEVFVGSNTAWIYYVEAYGNQRVLHMCETGL